MRALGQRASTAEVFREDLSPLVASSLRTAARDLEASLPRFKTREGYERAVESFQAVGSGLLQETSNAVGDEINRRINAAIKSTDREERERLSTEASLYADSETKGMLSTLGSISKYLDPGRAGAMAEYIVTNTWDPREGVLRSVATRGDEKATLDEFVSAFTKAKGRPPYLAEYAAEVEKGAVEFENLKTFRYAVDQVALPPGSENSRQAEVDAAVQNFTKRK